MTQMEKLTEEIGEVEAKRDFDQCLKLAKYLAYRVVDISAGGRALDRAILKNLGEDARVKIYRDALHERLEGDEFFEEERKFSIAMLEK